MSPFDHIPIKIALAASIFMVIGGLVLGIWTLTNVTQGGTSAQTDVHFAANNLMASQLGTNLATLSHDNSSGQEATSDNAVYESALALGVNRPISETLALATVGLGPLPHLLHNALLASAPDLAIMPRLTFAKKNPSPFFRNYFAAATFFNTLETALSMAEIHALWHNSVNTQTDTNFVGVAILEGTKIPLITLLGTPGPSVITFNDMAALIEATKQSDGPLALVPFEALRPTLAVLAVDGENPVENANQFDETAYPLVVDYYLDWQELSEQGLPTQGQAQLAARLDSLPHTNRDASRLTVVAMTGVTAMVRETAAQMDRFGPERVAEYVGPELASADITHISNEVPFVPGCETNTSPNNLIFCNPPEYMAALTACGVDIIGLTGNHQNDYGREDALKSLEIYARVGLPVYGGGINKEAAFAPHYIEHNGNRLAFLGANSYGPTFAWATIGCPGKGRAEFDLNIMSATIRNIKEQGRADLVLAELQYQETYEMMPLIEQRVDFNALIRAGADIVTGVQSHVPQAIEFTDDKVILYGLGNLFFDQMWSQSTREGLIVKHTIYEGHHISTRLLTTMLHDFGQPQWSTPAERDDLLNRLYQASYWD